MRQAILSVDNETLAEYGFGVFQDAGLLDIEILSCEGSRGVSRIHVEEQLDEQWLDELDMIQWWECVADEEPKYVYLIEMNVADQLERAGVDADGMTRTERAEVHEQGFTFDQTGSQEELSAMMAELQASGQKITLENCRTIVSKRRPWTH